MNKLFTLNSCFLKVAQQRNFNRIFSSSLWLNCQNLCYSGNHLVRCIRIENGSFFACSQSKRFNHNMPTGHECKNADKIDHENKLASICSKIRNIGLVAHIDAGKTTTTERILYYSGLTGQMGEVHDGDTVMDFMQQERERGITITMASATINWLGHRVNLIDTPGHVDFTFEVERSLSVLDGAVVILDGSAGVQAQTVKVWQQANRYRLPRIIFLNKMDKPNASFDLCLSSIERKLFSKPLPLQVPLYDSSKQLSGLIDVVSGLCYSWPTDLNLSEEGKRYMIQYLIKPENATVSPQLDQFLDPDSEAKYKEMLMEAREKLFGVLSDLDSEFAEIVLTTDNLDKISSETIQKVVREICLQQKAIPVLCGSSYKKIGVQPLLDSVIRYLPNPLQSERANSIFKAYNSVQNVQNNLCALAFKISFDRRLGLLTYVRIYSGSLAVGQSVYNLNRHNTEKITKIYRPFADHFADITTLGNLKPDGSGRNTASTVTVGDIVVVSGLVNTITGDTLVCTSHSQNTENHAEDMGKISPSVVSSDESIFAGIDVPDPVFYCSLESPSLSKMKQLEIALDQLQREDPSFKVVHDRNINQIVIKGMGELHIDIIKDRIKREYGIDVSSGPLQVSYQESICETASETMEMSKSIGGVNNYVKISLEIRPSENIQRNEQLIEHVPQQNKAKSVNIKLVNTKENNLAGQIRPWHLRWIHAGVFKALEYGPLFSFPVVGVDVLLHDFATTSRTSQAFVINMTSQCMLSALKQSTPILLEPIMQLDIVTPDNLVGAVISDLSLRRAEFGAEGSVSNETGQCPVPVSSTDRHLVAYVPLSELTNYSTVLRTLSSGMASFDMSLHSYRPMNEAQAAKAIRAISGVDY